MLKLKNYSVKLKEKDIINGVHLEVNDEIIAITGSNGAGKSSLALSILGHPNYTISGQIYLNNEDITNLPTHIKSQKGLFLSLQKPVAINGLSCLNFFKEISKKPSVEIIKLCKEYCNELDLPFEDLKKSINHEFSGGEQKKLEIIQMLLLKPKVIILDEIDSGLDVKIKEKIAKLINKYSKENKASFIVISHQPDFLDFLYIKKQYSLANGMLT